MHAAPAPLKSPEPCRRPAAHVAAAATTLLAGALYAQGQWAELRKQYLPAVTLNTPHAQLVDIDGDGDRDLLVTSEGPVTLRLLLNDGFGHFTETASWPSSSSLSTYLTSWPTVGDIDGDGDLDVAMMGGVLVNRGALGPQLVPAPFSPGGVTDCADLTGDGLADVVTTAGIWRSLGNGAFAQLAALTPSAWDSAVADLDGDGDLDLVFGRMYWAGPFPGPMTGLTTVWRNDGNGSFTDVTAQWFPGNSAFARTTHVVAGDFDRDGDPDCAFCESTRLILRRNDGTGVLQPWATYVTTEATGNIAVDLDGDGDLDLPGTLNTWLRNDGTGQFQSLTLPWLFGGIFIQAIGDVNGDGRPDGHHPVAAVPQPAHAVRRHLVVRSRAVPRQQPADRDRRPGRRR